MPEGAEVVLRVNKVCLDVGSREACGELEDACTQCLKGMATGLGRFSCVRLWVSAIRFFCLFVFCCYSYGS